ncbi:MAG TPA: CBS domain-containing protein [Rhizomicrobium sp.]|nr:CBS domain-containing protein [Rhizomicrobium sp.]
MKIENILDRKGEGVVTIDISLHLRSAAELMMRNRIAALIVTDGGEPVGLISEHDLVGALAGKGPRVADTPIREVITGPVLAVSPDESLKRVMAMMTRKRVRHLPVFEDSELIGIVSMGDLIKYRVEEMELESNVLRDLAIAAR